MTPDFVAVPVVPEVLARVLDRHADYRVLRRIGQMDRRPPPGPVSEGLVGVAIDLETTGLDFATEEVIELAMQRFRLDAQGRIVETGRSRSWLEQPTRPIPEEVTRVTGLTDGDVHGRAISEGEATGMILGADFVVAHNARFDRRFLERRLPMAAGRPWACSLADVDWAALGHEGRTLSGLLTGMGWFFDPHRAATDVTALLHLLDHPLEQGGTVAGRMLARARRPTWTVSAVGAPFSAKEVLRERGYRWDGVRRTWFATVAEESLREEVEWAALMLYGGRREPDVRKITWEERYAADPADA